MKATATLGVLFSWIFFVLLIYHVNYNQKIYFYKTIVVSPTGKDANLSFDEFINLDGDWSGWTFLLEEGTYTPTAVLDIPKESIVKNTDSNR